MTDPSAILRFHDAQKALLARTYDEAWAEGVASYEPDANPEEPAEEESLLPVIAAGGAAGLLARRQRKYRPPSVPDADRRHAALVPAIKGLDKMAEELHQAVPTSEQMQAASDAALAGRIATENIGNYAQALAVAAWLESNEWRLRAGESVAWAGEQAGYGQAAEEDGQLLDWESEGDSRVCFPAGTLIETETGPQSIEHIQPGDRVLTHTGHYRSVMRRMRRIFEGSLVELTTVTGRRLCSTPNHPVLVRQQGELRWCRADEIRSGDAVLLKHEKDIARARFGHADGCVAALTQVGIAPSVLSRVLMPVGTINLDNETFGEEEVHGVSSYSHLSRESDVGISKCPSRLALWRGLARVATPARTITKTVALGGAGPGTEGSTTASARDKDGRPSALLRAVTALIPAVHGEALAASGALPVVRLGAGALDGADPVAMRDRCVHAVLLAADRARLVHLRDRHAAGPRAEPTRFACLEDLAASLTDLRFPRSAGATASMGMLALPMAVAGHATKPLGRARTRKSKGLSALIAGAHCRLLARARPTPTARTRAVASRCLLLTHEHNPADLADAVHVYNLEVETDHTYVANGFVVHNCDDCIALSEMPPAPLSDWPTTPGAGDTICSVGCRCLLDVSDQQLTLDEGIPERTEAQEAVVSEIAERRDEALTAELEI